MKSRKLLIIVVNEVSNYLIRSSSFSFQINVFLTFQFGKVQKLLILGVVFILVYIDSSSICFSYMLSMYSLSFSEFLCFLVIFFRTASTIMK